MISMPSFAPSASKPRDNGAKREQNPRYGHYNGLSLPTRLWRLVHRDHAPEREINAAQGIEAANCTLEEKARGVRRSFLIRAHMMKAKIEERERRKIILN
jgi:hypothetical protein